MIPELQQLGFTRNEANVYLAVLKLGRASVQQLANATGLNRITVHSIVEKFEGMQIFVRSYEGKRRRVSAVDPERLEYLLKKEEQEVHRKQKVLADVMPSLNDLFLKTERGMKVTTFKGEKGFEAICEDALSTNEDMLEYANIDALNAVIGPYIASDYLPRKHKQKIRTKFLFVDSPSARKYIQDKYIDPHDPAPMEAKFISPKEFSMDAFFVIYGNKLCILTPSTLDGVIIEDQIVADSLRPFFHFVWSQAGEAVSNK